MSSKESKIEAWNQIKSLILEYGEYEPETNGDSIEDLSEEEIDTGFNQLAEKTKRPRVPIGGI